MVVFMCMELTGLQFQIQILHWLSAHVFERVIHTCGNFSESFLREVELAWRDFN